jgi:hypothetical protein
VSRPVAARSPGDMGLPGSSVGRSPASSTPTLLLWGPSSGWPGLCSLPLAPRQDAVWLPLSRSSFCRLGPCTIGLGRLGIHGQQGETLRCLGVGRGPVTLGDRWLGSSNLCACQSHTGLSTCHQCASLGGRPAWIPDPASGCVLLSPHPHPPEPVLFL